MVGTFYSLFSTFSVFLHSKIYLMTVERLNIQPNLLRWVIQRAGISEEKAIETFPLLNGWLFQEKQPTLNQLKKFAAKF